MANKRLIAEMADNRTIPLLFFKIINWTVVFLLIIIAMVSIYSTSEAQTLLTDRDLVKLSRSLTVRIIYDDNKPAGTGFFINEHDIVTCFHVVSNDAETKLDEKGLITSVKYSLVNNLRVVLSNGEVLPVKLISVPTKKHPEPIRFDFAILRISKDAQGVPKSIGLYKEGSNINVGDSIYFTGFPLTTPMMLTQKGIIAGFDTSNGIIALQAPVSKGTSGSAVISSDGTILGIVTYRLGGIGKGLRDLRNQIDSTSAQGNVKILGVDTLQATKNVIDVIDLTISTGIGYARSVIFLEKYLIDIKSEQEENR